jgi:hypothetical protein
MEHILMSDRAKDYITVSVWRIAFDSGIFTYAWAIRDGYDEKTFARGRSLTARGALRAVNKAHGKIERNTLKLNGTVKYNMFLSV